jgi:hypothetical protein
LCLQVSPPYAANRDSNEDHASSASVPLAAKPLILQQN